MYRVSNNKLDIVRRIWRSSYTVTANKKEPLCSESFGIELQDRREEPSLNKNKVDEASLAHSRLTAIPHFASRLCLSQNCSSLSSFAPNSIKCFALGVI